MFLYWQGLEYGTVGDIRERLRDKYESPYYNPINCAVVLDEDAAEAGMPHCWFFTNQNKDAAQREYQAHGGTVSALWSLREFMEEEV